jgi:hypothetical protein
MYNLKVIFYSYVGSLLIPIAISDAHNVFLEVEFWHCLLFQAVMPR